ncbi:MAG TPA: hypothetical protein VGP93_05615, partial [Polyangiaceae bacterium]|nr:hypothetical protein [Polyangiaceae bacterium]
DGVPGDLSVIWTEDDLLEGGPHWPKQGATWSLQIGAYANLLVGIYREFSKCVSGRSLSIEIGRKYRIRAEINENSLRLLLDGELVAEYEDLFPIPSGYVALYTFCPGKAFYNLKIYERGMPERLSPTAIGDAFYASKDYEQAARHYGRVEQLLPLTATAEEARYKRGLALLGAGNTLLAEQVWQGLVDELWKARAALHRVDAAFNAREHEKVVAELERLLHGVPALRTTIINRWADYVERLCRSDVMAVDIYAKLREAEFPEHLESASAAASAALSSGRWREVVERFPEQHMHFAEAASLLGDFESVVERYRKGTFYRNMALLRLGRFDELGAGEWVAALVKLLTGDAAAALEEQPGFQEAMLFLGQHQRVLEIEQLDREDRGAALRGLGRTDEAVVERDVRALAQINAGAEVLQAGWRLHERAYLLNHLTLRELFGGDADGYRRYRDQALEIPCGAIWIDVWVHRFLLFPLADELLGDRGALERSLRQSISDRRAGWFGKLWFVARYVLGELSEADFLDQPCKMYVESRLLFSKALRAELAADHDTAREHYRRYLALPELERAIDSVRKDPLVERWAAFRSG